MKTCLFVIVLCMALSGVSGQNTTRRSASTTSSGVVIRQSGTGSTTGRTRTVTTTSRSGNATTTTTGRTAVGTGRTETRGRATTGPSPPRRSRMPSTSTPSSTPNLAGPEAEFREAVAPADAEGELVMDLEESVDVVDSVDPEDVPDCEGLASFRCCRPNSMTTIDEKAYCGCIGTIRRPSFCRYEVVNEEPVVVRRSSGVSEGDLCKCPS